MSGEATGKKSRIQNQNELDVNQLAFDTAMRIFGLAKGFSNEEAYSLTDQRGRS